MGLVFAAGIILWQDRLCSWPLWFRLTVTRATHGSGLDLLLLSPLDPSSVRLICRPNIRVDRSTWLQRSRDKYGLMVLLYMRIRPDMLPRSSTVGSVHRCHRFTAWSYKYMPSMIQGMSSLIMRPWLFYRLHAGGRFPTLRLPQRRYTVSCSMSQAWEINGLSALHEIIWPPTRYINHQVIGLPFDTSICSNKFMAGN